MKLHPEALSSQAPSSTACLFRQEVVMGGHDDAASLARS